MPNFYLQMLNLRFIRLPLLLLLSVHEQCTQKYLLKAWLSSRYTIQIKSTRNVGCAQSPIHINLTLNCIRVTLQNSFVSSLNCSPFGFWPIWFYFRCLSRTLSLSVCANADRSCLYIVYFASRQNFVYSVCIEQYSE